MSRRLTIEPSRHHWGPAYIVYAHDRWPKSSVLYGRDRRTFVDQADDPAVLQARYPDAELLGHSTYVHDRMLDLPDENGRTLTEDLYG